MEREARIVQAALDASGLSHAARIELSGIGPRRARDAALTLVGAGAASLAAIGLAGALRDGISAGDLLLPDRVRDVDGALIAGGGGSRAHALRERLRPIATLHTGLLASVAQPAADEAAKRALASASGAIAVDMESAAVAGVARDAGLPWTVLRVVSDAVYRVLPRCAVLGVDGRGRVRPAALAAALACRPWELAGLLALGRDVRRAQQVLGVASAAALAVLCAP